MVNIPTNRRTRAQLYVVLVIPLLSLLTILITVTVDGFSRSSSSTVGYSFGAEPPNSIVGSTTEDIGNSSIDEDTSRNTNTTILPLFSAAIRPRSRQPYPNPTLTLILTFPLGMRSTCSPVWKIIMTIGPNRNGSNTPSVRGTELVVPPRTAGKNGRTERAFPSTVGIGGNHAPFDQNGGWENTLIATCPSPTNDSS
jgi:hypothetical protein